MPVYEYACTACGERTEAKQSFDDAPLETCEHCGGKLRKLYSPVGIVFKGSGFYSTDTKSKASSPSSSSKEDGAAADGSKTDKPDGTKAAASESKPASTPSTSSSKETFS